MSGGGLYGDERVEEQEYFQRASLRSCVRSNQRAGYFSVISWQGRDRLDFLYLGKTHRAVTETLLRNWEVESRPHSELVEASSNGPQDHDRHQIIIKLRN